MVRMDASGIVVAALYVKTDGVYFGLPDVDPWDEARDARLYAGPWPVVAHPPCQRWCQLASVNEARYGQRIGEDGGCFAAALEAVRTFGGVLEHPAYSLAWSRFQLPRPSAGGWQQAFDDKGFVTCVSQSAYGHAARKRTWLYLVGSPVLLDWRDVAGEGIIGSGVNTGYRSDKRRLEPRETLPTPLAFRDVLLDMARSARLPEGVT